MDKCERNKENMEIPVFVCGECGNKKFINNDEFLKYIDYDKDWPECCGYTMILGPDEIENNKKLKED